MSFFLEMLSLQETLFFLMVFGIAAKKLKVISEAGRKSLSNLLINVILPCNILESFMGGLHPPEGFARNCALAVIISVAIQVASTYGGRLLFRKYPPQRKSVLCYGIICPSSSFVGLPIAELLFGNLGVIYTAMFLIPLRFTIWTAGLSLFTTVSKKEAFGKLARHPCIICTFVGLFLMLVPVPLPWFVENTVTMVSDCTVPISMIVIGTILADTSIRAIFSRTVMWYTVLRLLICPLLVFVCLYPFRLDPTLVSVCILMMGMPAGSTNSILADQYGGDAAFASEIIFASTLFSIASIPLLTLLMGTALL